MTDQRDLRDRLGEMWRAIHNNYSTDSSPVLWEILPESWREYWIVEAEKKLLPRARSCGLKIVPNDGETK